jgi:hypothetical protein
MPRNGSGVAERPPGTTAVAGQTIESADFENTITDIYSMLNTAVPVAYGGTGASTMSGFISVIGGLPITGGAMTGALTLSADPTSSLQPATKQYTDSAVSTLSASASAAYLPKSGGTMTGAITLHGAPTSNLHAATKLYVDTQIASVGGSAGYVQVAESGAFSGNVRCAYATTSHTTGSMSFEAAYVVATLSFTATTAGAVCEVEFQSSNVTYDPVGSPDFVYALGLFFDATSSANLSTNFVIGRRMASTNDQHSINVRFRYVATDTSAHTIKICSTGTYGDFSHRHQGNSLIIRELA